MALVLGIPESQLAGLQHRAEVALLEVAFVRAEPLREFAHRRPFPEGADVEDELPERFRTTALSEGADAFPEDFGEFAVRISLGERGSLECGFDRRRRRVGGTRHGARFP